MKFLAGNGLVPSGSIPLPEPVLIQIYMMTSSNGNIFRVTGPLCGEFTSPGEFPTQRPVTRGFHVFFDLRLNKRLSKQSRGWWFETLSHPLWRHRNDVGIWRLYATLNQLCKQIYQPHRPTFQTWGRKCRVLVDEIAEHLICIELKIVRSSSDWDKHILSKMLFKNVCIFLGRMWILFHVYSWYFTHSRAITSGFPAEIAKCLAI